MKLNEPDLTPFRVTPGTLVDLRRFDTSCTFKEERKRPLEEKLRKDIGVISKLQYKLYAEKRQSLLIILQGMDSSGKDGTIRHIMSGINPQGVLVHSFKHPTEQELEHDYLWRHIQALPEHGMIAIFNRSHYENVLISMVHPELVLAERLPGIQQVGQVTKHFWEQRYAQINDFEKNTIQNGTQVLKFMLHISKDEQRNRFLERIKKPKKHWKFGVEDIAERAYWDQYQAAYELAITATSTPLAPWFIIPADNKISAHLLVTRAIVEKLKEMAPALPELDKATLKRMNEEGKKLKKEAAR